MHVRNLGISNGDVTACCTCSGPLRVTCCRSQPLSSGSNTPGSGHTRRPWPVRQRRSGGVGFLRGASDTAPDMLNLLGTAQGHEGWFGLAAAILLRPNSGRQGHYRNVRNGGILAFRYQICAADSASSSDHVRPLRAKKIIWETRATQWGSRIFGRWGGRNWGSHESGRARAGSVSMPECLAQVVRTPPLGN